MAAESRPIFSVSVRGLVEFVLRKGDLGGERAFTAAGRALAGVRGHQRVQRSKPAGYRKEVPVSFDLVSEELILRVQGRIDGVLQEQNQTTIEEIKTVQAGWDGEADPLHWAQAQLYGFIYAGEQALPNVTLQLTYLNLDTGEVTEFRREWRYPDLEQFARRTMASYLEWVRERHCWCQSRDRAIRSLAFPYTRYRAGQRELAEAAYRTLSQGGRLFLEAPTGIGKTVAILFPALKVLGEGKVERLFYLTARTIGRTVAEQTLAELRAAGLRLRAITLTAKEKLCVREGQPCDPRLCPLALGYCDRRHAAMRAALEREAVTRSVVEQIGQTHQVCPFELSLDLSEWMDAIICDYNYVFDPRVYLRRHFDEEPVACGFLVDEAHNLVDRAREMFSAELDTDDVQEVTRALKNALPRCAKALKRVAATIRRLAGLEAGATPPAPAEPIAELDLFDRNHQATSEPPQRRMDPSNRQAVVTRELPPELVPQVREAIHEAETWLARNQPASYRDDLLGLYFRLHSLLRTTDLYDERYVTIAIPGRTARLHLFCVDPSFLLGQALARAQAAVFFSATLTPMDHYRTLLGGRVEDRLLQLPSPFAPENLAVMVRTDVHTKLAARHASLDEVVEAMGTLAEARCGNYLAYFPSYEYLNAARTRFEQRWPAIRVQTQRPGMTETERETFLEAFTAGTEATMVAFAVMGGVFGEGIDLVGERLIGAMIVGVGLPQLCLERDLIRDYFDRLGKVGFDQAYTFPGMNRVLQAAGRVIRTEADRGVVLLLDARFAQARYRRLFPPWWQARRVVNAAGIRHALTAFWEGEE